ncbi:MAG: hypothetical protein ACJAUK_001003 [Colwellia polaris]|jgi:hypothetical protein
MERAYLDEGLLKSVLENTISEEGCEANFLRGKVINYWNFLYEY